MFGVGSRNLRLVLVLVIFLTLFAACVAHNTRLERKRESVGGVRCTLVRGRKVPLVPAMPVGSGLG